MKNPKTPKNQEHTTYCFLTWVHVKVFSSDLHHSQGLGNLPYKFHLYLILFIFGKVWNGVTKNDFLHNVTLSVRYYVAWWIMFSPDPSIRADFWLILAFSNRSNVLKINKHQCAHVEFWKNKPELPDQTWFDQTAIDWQTWYHSEVIKSIKLRSYSVDGNLNWLRAWRLDISVLAVDIMAVWAGWVGRLVAPGGRGGGPKGRVAMETAH